MVKTVVDGQRKLFESLGCVVEDGEPDFSGADEAFRTWRAWYYQLAFGKLLKPYRHLIKATVIEEIENGARLTGERIAQAEAKRTALYHRVRACMETHEVMVLPVKLARNTDWMRSAYYISSIGLPAISVPAGFTPEGLPVGIQIVGRHHDDFGVLQLAYAFEKTAQAGNQKPPVAD